MLIVRYCTFISLLMFVLCSLAMPELITTQPQTFNISVGDSISLPSFITVSALAQDVEVIWFRLDPVRLPAENGAVASDYSYKLDNVTMSDAGRYHAQVRVPDGNAVNGPIVDLIVSQKPAGRFP